MLRYKRVFVKLSGGVVVGNFEFGFELERLDYIVDEIMLVVNLGVEVLLVIGGGNIFRGNMVESWGIERVEVDNIGMFVIVVNSLMFCGVFKVKI